MNNAPPQDQNIQNSPSLKDVIFYFENHPATFIIVGLFCFLAASQGLKLQVGSYAINLIAPSDQILKSLFLFIAISLLTIGIYFVLSKWDAPQKIIIVFLCFFFFVSAVCSFFPIFTDKKEPPFPLTRYGYDITESSFLVGIDCSKISEHTGKNLIGVIRRKDSSVSVALDPFVDISKPFPIKKGHEGCIDIKVKAYKIKGRINLGDKVQCFVFSLGTKVDISDLKKIQDILDVGGKEIWGCAHTVSIIRGTPEELSFVYKALDGPSKQAFREQAGI